jgi:hypothetical protein
MITNRSMPPGSVIPELGYADVPAAARWLCTAFGFRERLRIGSHRIQLLVGDGSVVVVEGEANSQSTCRVMVRLGSGSIPRWISAGIVGHSRNPSLIRTRRLGAANSSRRSRDRMPDRSDQ